MFNFMTLENIEKELEKHADSEKAKISQGFFKTNLGQYGEGDVFLGISVPQQRQIAREFKDLDMNKLQELLNSDIHEKRLIALLILIEQFKKASKEKNPSNEKQIIDFYLDNAKKNNINNWDLVDLSAHKIIGGYLLDKNNKEKDILYNLAKSKNLWEKRIAIVSCFAFIRTNDFEDAIKISEILLKDSHDLIHKSVGWMLREVGKKDEKVLEDFLKRHYKQMSRTTLRYAIERFEEKKRLKYLRGEI